MNLLKEVRDSNQFLSYYVFRNSTGTNNFEYYEKYIVNLVVTYLREIDKLCSLYYIDGDKIVPYFEVISERVGITELINSYAHLFHILPGIELTCLVDHWTVPDFYFWQPYTQFLVTRPIHPEKVFQDYVPWAYNRSNLCSSMIGPGEYRKQLRGLLALDSRNYPDWDSRRLRLKYNKEYRKNLPVYLRYETYFP